MTEPSVFIHRRGLAQLFNRRRLRVTAIATLLLALPMSLGWQDAKYSFFMRAFLVGFSAMLAFGLAEQWPRRLPTWLARWALQVVAVALIIPLCTFTIYVLSTKVGAPMFWHDGDRRSGYMLLTILPLLVAPWIALTALVRQREAWAREQALAFELERSELARQALDARMRLLSAQVQPHFLFNTLANVHALVETGSPHAAAVLEQLIEYLRAAVPRLDESQSLLRQELELVRAYLGLMQMRMPDRLRYEVQVEPSCLSLRCPAMTVLTLVENAVRHGVDPSEVGGEIEVRVWREGRRCRVRVSDSGVGLRQGGGGLGTGLAGLRERLALVFAGDASLQLRELQPHGVCAELDFPAQEQTA
ncbi:histidine kinase [Paucibacter sp. APW11]|uniref:Histidine kinase n=1 Tax=Roseateles aquae TaxID=3077235 RepID=A0ABU3PBQ9_9BURK|nr:histidine kinase [Paucibacter sp. APW11]MDT8999980.1 histidine kinase [Paucibacter sp. APW11]